MMTKRPERHDRYMQIRDLNELRSEKMKLRAIVTRQEGVLKTDYHIVSNKLSFLSMFFSAGKSIVQSFSIFNGLRMGMKVFSFLFPSGKKKRNE
ncbi:MAG: hypothetical protein ACRC9Q_02000 [Bacteroidales bacterium]